MIELEKRISLCEVDFFNMQKAVTRFLVTAFCSFSYATTSLIDCPSSSGLLLWMNQIIEISRSPIALDVNSGMISSKPAPNKTNRSQMLAFRTKNPMTALLTPIMPINEVATPIISFTGDVDKYQNRIIDENKRNDESGNRKLYSGYSSLERIRLGNPRSA